jgi:hypothetical protein
MTVTKENPKGILSLHHTTNLCVLPGTARSLTPPVRDGCRAGVAPAAALENALYA